MNKERIEELEHDIATLQFKMKRALHSDYFHDADKYSVELAEKKKELESYKTKVTVTVDVPDHVHDLFMRLRSYMVTRDDFSIGDRKLIEDLQKKLNNERIKRREA